MSLRRRRGRHARRNAAVMSVSAALPVAALVPAALAGHPAAMPHPAVVPAPATASAFTARTLLTRFQVRTRAHAAAEPAVYVVAKGDSLSKIAARQLGKASRWEDLYGFNRHVVGPDPDLIVPGQHLRLPPATYRYTYVPPAPAPAPAAVVSYSAPAAAPAPAPAPVVSYSGGGSFQSCVIQAESGGDASAVNPSSGAGGLYGFLPSTWQALGFSGLPENASVATQNAAFAAEYAQGGASAWAPYDGC